MKILLAQVSRPVQKCYLLVIFIVTFFVIDTKKVTKEKSRQTRSLRAFCLASATYFGRVILSDSEGSPV
jgi:hypothetical protein